VASDIPGCREVIIDGLNGFLVPPKQAVPLAEAIEKIIMDKRLMEKMGKESRKIAERDYSVEKINRETIFEYNKLIIGENTKKLVY
jgi:glycosyltransferase involved in cell wall biosynthesis